MRFEVDGKLHKIFDTQEINERFRKREFVLEIQDGAYMSYPKFEMTQNAVSILDNFKEGDIVHVTFGLSGRPYTNKDGQEMYFTSLRSWRIEYAQMGQPQQGYGQQPAQGGYQQPQQVHNQQPGYAPAPPAPQQNQGSDDDLPF